MPINNERKYFINVTSIVRIAAESNPHAQVERYQILNDK